MEINRKNYEQFAIDYIENNLNSEVLLEFEKFLQQNPDIKAEISELQNSFISEKQNIIYDEKFMLKKSPIDELNYIDYLIISDIEDTITQEEKQELNNHINNNSQFLDEYEIYSKTILPKKDVIFENKSSLKKSNKAFLTTVVSLAVAASLIIFYGIFFKSDNFQNAYTAYQVSVNFNSRNFVIPQKQTKEIKVGKFFQNSINTDTNTSITQENKIIADNSFDEIALRQKMFRLSSEQIVCNNIQNLRQETFYEYNKQKNLDIFENINPIVVINALFKGYEIATENENLNMKLAYNKNDKQVNFDYKNKVYEVTMR